MSFNIFESAKDHHLVVAHRGACGGNIPCNTMAAYEIALKQGADMIETDISRSKDGKLLIFHPGMERVHLYHNERLHNMTAEEISHLRFANQDGTRTQFPIYTFDDLLETFKGRCYINVDKFWEHPQEITDAIRRHNMEDQCIVKYYPSKEWIDRVEAIAPDLPSMPIVRDAHPFHEELCKRNMNYIGAEVLFADESSEMASDAFIDKMHADGKLVWVNSIIYNYRDQLAAGHSDDTALCEDMEKGWGWLADKNYDLIQTDWTMMLVDFLKKTGRYNR